MRARMLGALMAATAGLMLGCQPSDGGGGGTQRDSGYDKTDQPAVNKLGTPDPVTEGGRVGRDYGGPNSGAQGNPPPEGYRGSGSDVNPPSKRILEEHKVGSSPAPRSPASSR